MKERSMGKGTVIRAARAGASLAALYLAMVAGASAQAAAADAAAPPADADTTRIQEIVVTAERRSVNLQKTAISMSALVGEQLRERQVSRIQDLESQVPGLSFTQSGFTNNVNLRGLGNTTVSPNITTGVAVLHDGLYQPEAILLSTPFYDVADVEVLRGPQGTIVGQNSTGGSLQVNSRSPELGASVGGYVEANFGNYGERRLSGAVNLPISETWAARVAFNGEKRDSFYRNRGPVVPVGTGLHPSEPGGVDELNGRFSLLWRPSVSFQALFKAELNSLDTGGLTTRPRPACSTCTPNSSFYAFGYAAPSALNGFHTMSVYDLAYNTNEMQKDTANRFSIELKYTFDGGIVARSLTGFQHLREVRVDDGDASAAPVGSIPQGSVAYHVIGPKDDYYSQEFNLISPDGGRLTWLLGASYFFRETPVALTIYPDGATPDVTGAQAQFVLDSRSTQRLVGVFGQVGYQITPKLQLQIGGRYSFDEGNGSGTLQLAVAPGFKITLPQNGHYAAQTPSGKVALNWQINPKNFAYIFFARGYKEGGINGAQSNFRSELVNDYEIGWKSQLFDNHVRTQIGGYYMQYYHMQQQTLDPLTTANQVVNIGDSTLYGLEASMQARFGRISFDAGLAYNHSKLGATSAVAAYQLPAGQLPPQCAPGQTAGCFDYTPYIVNLAGSANPYSPRYTINVSAAYDIPIGAGVLTPRASFSYVSSQYASIFQNTTYFLIPSHRQVDAYLTYRAGDWDVEGYVRNLAQSAFITGLNNATAFYSAPRTYGVRISRRF
jgi:iron complex outermembrane receptor protein